MPTLSSFLTTIICCTTLLLVVGTDQASAASATADRIMRFVNNDVITQGDVWDEMRRRYVTLRHRGEPLPDGREALEQFQKETLEELTDTMLLEQEAQRLGIQLDELAIRRQVREWIRDNNLPPTLDHESQEQQRRLREAYVYTVLRHYQTRWPSITPTQIRENYERNQERFSQEPRVRPARILLRRQSPDDQRRLLRSMMDILQQIQTDRHPEVVAAADDETLSRIVRSDENERPGIIATVLEQARAAIPENPPATTAQLGERIDRALGQWQGLQDTTAAERQLRDLREELMAIEDPDQRLRAFQEQAQARSQGPRANDGGDMGWFERGSEDSSLESIAFSLPVGSISEPFQTGAFLGIIMVREREDSTVRDLRQVAPEIRSQLESERLDAIRSTLVQQLRTRGVVEDLEQATRLPEEWFTSDDAIFSE